MDRLSTRLKTPINQSLGASQGARVAAPGAMAMAIGLGCAGSPAAEGAGAPSFVDASTSPSTCSVSPAPVECGDPCGEGVVVDGDVIVNTVWDCPVYTLPAPVYVRGAGSEPTRLVIAPGTVIKGRAGDLDEGRLPGALIITRSGQIDARGTSRAPIVFTSARPPGERAPGDWGGVVLLGRAATNVPGDYEGSGNRAGEMFIEGLPRGENTTYGASVEAEPEGVPAASGPMPSTADPQHDCGTLRYVRIEFAGFEVGDTNELNGLTVGACGTDTVLDYLQVHLGSDDGIEFFGGTTDLRHALITGASDDSLDWDQGWSGRVQFLAIRQTLGGESTDESDSGFEGDGYADPDAALGEASAPVMYNVTLLSSERASRAIRLREGSRLILYDAILAAERGGPLDGLIDIGDALTADQLTLRQSRIESSIFQGSWPITVQGDSSGNTYLAEDYFTIGSGSSGNTVLSSEDVERLLPDGFAADAPGWRPIRGSHASSGWTRPSEPDERAPFFDTDVSYRGAFDPSGEDWTAGWAAYPTR